MRAGDEYIYENLYCLLGSYVDIVPHLALDEIIEYFPGAVEAFCVTDFFNKKMDPYLLDYMQVITLLDYGDGVIDALLLNKHRFFQKLVLSVTHDDIHVAFKAICVITNISGLDDNWFAEAFEDTDVVNLTLGFFERRHQTHFLSVLKMWTNFMIGSEKLAAEIATNHNLIFTVMKKSEEMPEVDEPILAFFDVILAPVHRDHSQSFVISNPEILDFFIRKIKLGQKSNVLFRVCKLIRDLIQIGQSAAVNFSGGQNMFIIRFEENRSLTERFEHIGFCSDPKVRNAYQHLLQDYFYEDMECED